MWYQTVHDCSLDGPLQSLAFLFNMEFKMAATAWLGLTSDPMGKCFKRHLGQLKLNLETELRRNVFGASGERYRLLRASGFGRCHAPSTQKNPNFKLSPGEKQFVKSGHLLACCKAKFSDLKHYPHFYLWHSEICLHVHVSATISSTWFYYYVSPSNEERHCFCLIFSSASSQRSLSGP